MSELLLSQQPTNLEIESDDASARARFKKLVSQGIDPEAYEQVMADGSEKTVGAFMKERVAEGHLLAEVVETTGRTATIEDWLHVLESRNSLAAQILTHRLRAAAGFIRAIGPQEFPMEDMVIESVYSLLESDTRAALGK